MVFMPLIVVFITTQVVETSITLTAVFLKTEWNASSCKN